MKKEISSNNYDITHEIKEQRFFTTEDIAKMLDCTPSVIRNITSYYHINSEEMVREKSVRHAVYSYQAFKEIKWYREEGWLKQEQSNLSCFRRKQKKKLQRLKIILLLPIRDVWT